MNDEELEKWILRQREQGFSDQKIHDALIEEGLSEATINQAFSDIQASQQAKPDQTQPSNQQMNQNSQAQNDSGKDEEASYREFDIVKAVKNGLNFLKTREAFVSFGYLTGSLLLLFLTAIGIKSVGENGPLFGIIGMAPLGLAFVSEIFLLGYSYVKFFRIILRGVGVQIEPLSTTGMILTIIRLGIGFIMYFAAILLGLFLLLLPGIYLAFALFFWNYGVMQGKGLLHSFKQSFEIVSGNILKLVGLSFTTSIISSAVSLIFRLPSEAINIAGYTNIGALVALPGIALSTMATISIMGTAYAMLLDERKRKDNTKA